MPQQPFLPPQPTAIPGQATIRPDQPMARHQNAQRIGPIRRPHRTHRTCSPNPRRQPCICHGFPRRNVAQRAPYSPLKLRPTTPPRQPRQRRKPPREIRAKSRRNSHRRLPLHNLKIPMIAPQQLVQPPCIIMKIHRNQNAIPVHNRQHVPNRARHPPKHKNLHIIDQNHGWPIQRSGPQNKQEDSPRRHGGHGEVSKSIMRNMKRNASPAPSSQAPRRSNPS